MRGRVCIKVPVKCNMEAQNCLTKRQDPSTRPQTCQTVEKYGYSERDEGEGIMEEDS